MAIQPICTQVNDTNTFKFLGNTSSLLVSGDETDGQFAILQMVETKGCEPPPHVHHREDESFFILEGEIEYTIGDKVYHAKPGTYLFAPRGIVHSFRLETNEAKYIVTAYPAGFDKFVKELAVHLPGPLLPGPGLPPNPEDVGLLVSTAAKYGIDILGG
ncbi:cupin domain-containing protein [Cohnella panacarvi]|uniref:cupin domain-containing protein n=1 Tax=Cohnella panacarvi TaxID=400776 RepID=UPI00047D547D|nr:cupin domain-containing protein [Cohnella panacarvi]